MEKGQGLVPCPAESFINRNALLSCMQAIQANLGLAYGIMFAGHHNPLK
jgi:hypothetical protein